METLYLKTLVVAVDSGSFSRAATVLNITQSAVSQRIKLLEERYGYQLLDRSGPVLVATEAGRVVLAKAQEILRIESELANELKHMEGKPRLSICCTPTFGIVYLPGVLNRFMLQNADIVDLKFMFYTPEQAIKGLHENEFDVGVIEHCEPLELSGFKTFQLPRDELIFISSPGLRLPSEGLDIDHLLPHRLIARKVGCSSRKLLELNMAAIGRNLRDFERMIVYDDLRLTIDTVIGGGGIAFVSRSLVKKQLADGSLLEYRLPGFIHNRFRTAALNKKRTMDKVLQNFMDCIFSTFPDEGDDPNRQCRL